MLNSFPPVIEGILLSYEKYKPPKKTWSCKRDEQTEDHTIPMLSSQFMNN